MDYVPLVHQLLSERVDTILQSYVKRKEYVAALLSMMGKSVLEYDTEAFKKIAFLFEQQGFSFVVHCKSINYCMGGTCIYKCIEQLQQVLWEVRNEQNVGSKSCLCS